MIANHSSKSHTDNNNPSKVTSSYNTTYKLDYIKIDVLIKDKKPQDFIGSMLRGALGYSLKKVVCINPSYTCDNCFAQNSCVYYDFYEVKNVTHQFRIDISLHDEIFKFGIYLFDKAVDKLPYLISAIHKLLKETGLGVDRKKYDNFYIYINDNQVYDGKAFNLPKNSINSFQNDTFCPDITLQLVSPLRIKKDNKFLKKGDFTLDILLNSIYQRYLQLTQQQQKKLPFKVKCNVITKDLELTKITRFSNRQKTKMNMDGIMGNIVIENIDKESYDILKLGEIIGVGKQTVMGLGKIKIKETDG